MKTFQDPNQVKVVLSLSGFALFFSRAQIPYDREHAGVVGQKLLQASGYVWIPG
jgi:CMP-2-keto-3-deoxyoctulosonic acid synthetase